jgi:uncharacterized protein (DUF433 family)
MTIPTGRVASATLFLLEDPTLASITPPKLKDIRPIEPEHLEGDKIQPGHPLFGLIWINRERVSGTPCFYVPRVPVKTLFDCFAAGETLEDFLYGFEGVTREQALGVLELAASGLLIELERL